MIYVEDYFKNWGGILFPSSELQGLKNDMFLKTCHLLKRKLYI